MSMKWDNHGMKTQLARARGLGTSRAAVPGWIRLRVTAIGIAVLSLWFLWFLSQTIGASHEEFTAKLADPRNAICMLLLIIAAFSHAVLGNREIVEDYIHHEGFKIFKLIGTYLFFFALALACGFSVLKIAL